MRWLTVVAMADELREKILGGQMQKVLLSAPFSLGLEIYADRWAQETPM